MERLLLEAAGQVVAALVAMVHSEAWGGRARDRVCLVLVMAVLCCCHCWGDPVVGVGITVGITVVGGAGRS